MPVPTLADAASRTMAKKNWVKKAVPDSHRGRFREKAERAGESTSAFARKHEHDSGTLGKQARLAETLMGMSRKRGDMYSKSRDRMKD